jgi:branched-chain amino acid transport system permease protein
MTAVRAAAGWLERHAILAFVVLFALVPHVVPYYALVTQILTYGLFAMGFNLLYGYTGMLSFGHAAYFGLGAYGTGLALAKLGLSSTWGALGIGVVAAAVGAAVIGYLCMRRRGVYFGLLTLAFAQVLYFVVFQLGDLTGGEDGLRGLPSLAAGFPGGSISLESPLAFYYFVLGVVTLALCGLKRLLGSPFGAVLRAVRENGERCMACGYDVRRVRIVSFVFSGVLAGLAGGLNALHLRIVPIDTLYWTTSGQVMLMTLVGGGGTFFGPFVGASIFLALEDLLALVTQSWQLVMGAIFVCCVVFLPRGILGTLSGRFAARDSDA